jgi:hypothetical protein
MNIDEDVVEKVCPVIWILPNFYEGNQEKDVNSVRIAGS